MKNYGEKDFQNKFENSFFKEKCQKDSIFEETKNKSFIWEPNNLFSIFSIIFFLIFEVS